MPTTNPFAGIPNLYPTTPTGTGTGGSGYQNPYYNLGNYNQPTGGYATDYVGQTTLTSPETNLAAWPQIADLINKVNALNTGAQQAANLGRIPGEPQLESQSSMNIANELQGKIPQDVVDQLSQQAAERGVAMGVPGSDNTMSGLLRALGLTSLQLQSAGQNDFSSAVARNPTAGVVNPLTQFLGPQGITYGGSSVTYNNAAANPGSYNPTISPTTTTPGSSGMDWNWLNSLFGGSGGGSASPTQPVIYNTDTGSGQTNYNPFANYVGANQPDLFA